MTHRLYGLARHHWSVFDGWAASRNVEPLRLKPDRYLSLIYYWAIRNAGKDEREKFDRQLWRPPKGVAAPPGSPWSAEAETSAFGSLAAQVGVKTGRSMREGAAVDSPKG